MRKRLCCTHRNVPHSEDELNLRRILVKLLGLQEHVAEEQGTSITGKPTDFCTAAPSALSPALLVVVGCLLCVVVCGCVLLLNGLPF